MFDLENQGQTLFLHDLSYLRLQTWYEVDLSVDSNIFEIEDIKNVENKHLTLTVDLETQGHTLFSYDLAYLRLYACYWLDLGVESNIFKVEDLRKIHFRVPDFDVWPWFSRSNYFSLNLYYFQGQSS